MTTIAYVIINHGLGHTTRSIAIIRSILECDLEVFFNIHPSTSLSFI